MEERTFISFDWAIKKVLRHKENFSVLEGFLSELLLDEAKLVLRYENMNPDDKASYRRHIENRRIEMGVVGTAIDKATRKNSIQIALNALQEHIPINIITKITKLTTDEVERLAKGEDIDKEDDED